MLSRLVSGLDTWLYRRPFEGAGARRYTSLFRPGFGDLDARLITRWHDDLVAARTVLDLGAGAGAFAARLRREHPGLAVVAVEPSTALCGATHGISWLRARAEALPLADASIDVAVSLSSIRHVHDRLGALRELHRVVVPGGVVYIVELDPRADRQRIRNHRRALGSPLARLTFGPLLVKTAPPLARIAALARAAGFAGIASDADPVQPFYIMRLTR